MQTYLTYGQIAHEIDIQNQFSVHENKQIGLPPVEAFILDVFLQDLLKDTANNGNFHAYKEEKMIVFSKQLSFFQDICEKTTHIDVLTYEENGKQHALSSVLACVLADLGKEEVEPMLTVVDNPGNSLSIEKHTSPQDISMRLYNIKSLIIDGTKYVFV